MFKKDKIKKEKSLIETLVSRQKFKYKCIDKTILDNENAVIVVEEKYGIVMIHEKLINGKLVKINEWFMDRYYFYSIYDSNLLGIFVMHQKTEDKYILDNENAIIVIKDENGYVMIHERLVDDDLVEINRWPMDNYYFGSIHDAAPIESLGLFKIQSGRGTFDALYDYKNDKFVIPPKTWEDIDFGRCDQYLEKYNGVLAYFSISSDYEKDDLFTYENEITGEEIEKSFRVKDGYYAIINFDGTIRENKLFKGSTFSKITEIIDLDKYESLDAFKEERKKICNDIKKKQKQEYYQMIEERNDGNISPYLDSEVARIFNLKK